MLDYETAVRLALGNLETGKVETTWRDAAASSQRDRPPVTLSIREGIIVERRQIVVHASATSIYESITRLGGKTGWLYMNWAWRLRAIVDRLMGGVGFRGGRRDPMNLRVGDALDFCAWKSWNPTACSVSVPR